MAGQANSATRVFAIVPAAGRSRRMGAAKQLLDVGGRPMLADVLNAVAASQVEGVALVTHSAIASQLDLSRWPCAFLVLNDDESTEMIDSVRLGMAAWSARQTIAPADGFLICPADQPGISPVDFNACIAAFRATPDRIIIGSRAGRRGHPLIFPASLADFVKSPACNAGLNGLPRTHPDRVVLVECSSSGVTRDMDTPRDYEEASMQEGPMPRRAEPELMDLPEEAEAYAKADFAEVNEAYVQRVIEVAGPLDRASVLDLGCGPGDIAIRFARKRPGWRIVAADASQAMLDLARKAVDAASLTQQIELVLTDAKSTHFADGSFDVVTSSSLLHHVADPIALWRELRRVARPGATLLLRDLMRPASDEQARAIVRQYAGSESTLLQEEFHRSLLAAYTPDEVRSQVDRAGLTGMKVAVISDRHLDVFGRLA